MTDINRKEQRKPLMEKLEPARKGAIMTKTTQRSLMKEGKRWSETGRNVLEDLISWIFS